MSMERKIIVAGAGHGGIVAAYYMAQSGLDVTVYEKKARDELGYDQNDSVHLDGFELAGIPVPEEYVVQKTPITFSLMDSDVTPISQLEASENVTVDISRKMLYNYLIDMAQSAGVKFIYGCEIYSPIVLGSRVIGIKTSLGDILADLVIDAAGVFSPIRSNLPDFMNITKNPGKNDVLKSYRAYFNRIADAPKPEYKYLISLIPGEKCGILWVITKEDCIDVFISSMNNIEQADVDHYLDFLRKNNPQIGIELVKGGVYSDIPVRAPLSVLVADGYAAVGDSAFMTIPIKGSGVGYSMRAGKILAEAVIDDADGLYDREHLWGYQTEFFEEIGSGAGSLAVMKSLFPLLTHEDMEYVLGQQIITSEEFTLFGSEQGILKIVSSIKMAVLKDKAKKLVNFPNLMRHLTFLTGGITRYKMIQARMRSKYDSVSVAKWAESYDSFFEGLKQPKEPKTKDDKKHENDSDE